MQSMMNLELVHLLKKIFICENHDHEYKTAILRS